jgi:hypothetical protein
MEPDINSQALFWIASDANYEDGTRRVVPDGGNALKNQVGSTA